MSITDELREWAEGNTLRAGMSLRVARDQALAIADRIDAEHELEVTEAHAKGMHEGFAADKGPRDFVELPKDADGEYIHIGDVMEWPTTGETFEVVGIGDGVLFYVDDGNEQADWTGASTKRHAPTVEDVLREFADKWMDVQPCREPEIIAEYAKRLRLAGDVG